MLCLNYETLKIILEWNKAITSWFMCNMTIIYLFFQLYSAEWK